MYLIDTNILIYFLNGSIPDHSIEFITRLLSYSFKISVISKLEFLGWKGFDSETFMRASEFVDHADVIGFNSSIEDNAIALRRSVSIGFADAIIAATALNVRATLITRNEDDFKNVRGLTILNPWNKLES